MAEEDPFIVEALGGLEAENPEAASDAEAALEWLTWGEGLSVVTQERLQHFLWYGLPMKWRSDANHHRSVVAALARAFDLLGLSRYAALCRSKTTTEVLAAYERSDAEGQKAFNRADVASGIRPPDTSELEWGAVMGMEESAALSSTADLLELAVASGDLVPGARGWKQRQRGLTLAHLVTPRVDLAGRSLLDVIRDERLTTWLERWHSPTRHRLLDPIAEAVAAPATLPEGVDDPIPPLRWLLGELADGQPLTQTGNLNRALVQDAAPRFGWWDFPTPPRHEDDLYDLHRVRNLAQRLGLARRSGRKLSLTSRGRSTLDDPDLLWRTTARGILPDHDFAAALGELTLALLTAGTVLPADDLDAIISEVVGEVGWRSSATGAPPDAHDISWAWHQTTNLLRALNLLSTGGDWSDRSYGLTPTGRAVALQCLHHRAAGPRTSPWT